MISIESWLVALALIGAPGELPSSPSAPPASPPELGVAAPIERRPPSRRATAFIKGRVVSRGAPVAYAHVWMPAYHLGDMANENGAFTLTRVPAGVCTLQILGPGYYRRSLPILVADPGLDSLVVAIDPVSTPVASCNPWFEVDPKQGDSWNVRAALCGNGGGSASLSRNWGRLSIAEIASACELTVQWGWSGRDAARVTVRDSSGAVIRTLVEPDPSRPASRGGAVTWDGTRDDGSVATAGEYRVRIEARGKRLELAALLRRYGP